MSDWLEAEQRVERAQQLTESARWEEALAELDIAISINPHNAMWHAQRGFLLEELDRLSEAAIAYERSIRIEEGECEVSMALANVLLREGRFRRAVEVLEDVARRYPDYEPAYCHRVRGYSELGLHDKAEEMFYLAQELDESCPHCFFFLGGSLAARGQHARAIYCWNRTLELAPCYVGVYRRIAQAYRAMGKPGRARAFYLQELREDPGNTDLLFEMGELATEAGKRRKAAAKFEQVLELDPLYSKARFALGKVLLEAGSPKRAVKCFEQFALCDPVFAGTAEFSWYLGRALLGAGQFQQAAARLRTAADRDPDHLDVWQPLAECYMALGRYREAADCWRPLVVERRDDYVVNYRLGLCLLEIGRPAEALECFHAALQIKPESGEARCSEAAALASLGRWRAARRTLKRASGEPARVLRQSLWRERVKSVFASFRHDS